MPCQLRPSLPFALRMAWVWLALAGAVPSAAQTPVPSPLPPNLEQDALDLQANASVVQGSGARALGMGGAFLARADDATAASWNPAGLSYLRKPELSFVWNTTNRLSASSLAPDGVTSTDDREGNSPDFLAVTYPFSLGRATGAAQVSFQRVIPFAGSRTIVRPDPGVVIEVESSGGFDVLAFGSGFHVSRRLRLGFAVNRWFRGYGQDLERQFRRRSLQETEFDLQGWNLHLGAIWMPIETLNVGAVLKTPFSGDVRLSRSRVDLISQPPDEPDLITQNQFTSDDVTLEFPGAVGVGVSWRPRSALTLSLDATQTFWSEGRIRNFFTLPPATPDGEQRPDGSTVTTPTPPAIYPLLPYPTLSDPQQQDTPQLRFGVEYVIIFRRLKLPVRAGAFLDTQYFRAKDGNPPRYEGFSVGSGLIVGPVLLDVAYIHERGRYTAADDSRVSVDIDRVFASVIYRHGR